MNLAGWGRLLAQWAKQENSTSISRYLALFPHNYALVANSNNLLRTFFFHRLYRQELSVHLSRPTPQFTVWNFLSKLCSQRKTEKRNQTCLWLLSGMSSTNPNIISAILLELQVGVLSTSTAMDSMRCSWHTTLRPGQSTGERGSAGGCPAGRGEGPAVFRSARWVRESCGGRQHALS